VDAGVGRVLHVDVGAIRPAGVHCDAEQTFLPGGADTGHLDQRGERAIEVEQAEQRGILLDDQYSLAIGQKCESRRSVEPLNTN
jgi:hypothetical protein